MQKVKKIYERNFKYTLLSRYVFIFMRIFYRKIYVCGIENIPTDGPVIFAPNHKNALMDPLLILYALPHEQVVFMARGDVFFNKTVTKFLRFLKILPVFRMRDGIGNLGKNEVPFQEAVETLKAGRKLCLMPEGQQVEVRRLLPLVKGMFRIGFQAQEEFGPKQGVRIVPMGIEYEDLVDSGRNVQLQFGKPIELSKYYELYIDNPAQAYNELRDELYPEISKLMLNIQSEKYYDTIYLSTLIQVDEYLRKNQLQDNEWNRLKAKQDISAKLVDEERNNPERIEKLSQKIRPLYSSGKRDDEIYRILKKLKAIDYFKICCFLPFFIGGTVFMLLPYGLVKAFMKKEAKKIEGFESSLSFVIGMIIPPLFFILYFLISLIWLPISYAAIIFLIIVPILSIISFRLKNIYIDSLNKLLFKKKFEELS